MVCILIPKGKEWTTRISVIETASLGVHIETGALLSENSRIIGILKRDLTLPEGNLATTEILRIPNVKPI
jgi:hypothetical protein